MSGDPVVPPPESASPCPPILPAARPAQYDRTITRGMEKAKAAEPKATTITPAFLAAHTTLLLSAKYTLFSINKSPSLPFLIKRLLPIQKQGPNPKAES